MWKLGNSNYLFKNTKIRPNILHEAGPVPDIFCKEMLYPQNFRKPKPVTEVLK